jgi:hypothetical protein
MASTSITPTSSSSSTTRSRGAIMNFFFHGTTNNNKKQQHKKSDLSSSTEGGALDNNNNNTSPVLLEPKISSNNKSPNTSHPTNTNNSHKSFIHMQQMMETDPSLRNAFREFAKDRYVSESLRFLEDLIEYRTYFWEKTMSWRTSKITHIFTTYIQVGCANEINVSSSCRQIITSKYQTIIQTKTANLDCKVLFEIFEEAEKQIGEMVANGPWYQFLMIQQRKRRGSSGSTLTT